ncbi:hypothetical protein D3C73_1477850 [compost metagenome]
MRAATSVCLIHFVEKSPGHTHSLPRLVGSFVSRLPSDRERLCNDNAGTGRAGESGGKMAVKKRECGFDINIATESGELTEICVYQARRRRGLAASNGCRVWLDEKVEPNQGKR